MRASQSSSLISASKRPPPPLAPVSSLAPLATLPNVLADGRGRRRRRRRLPQRHEHSAFVVTSRQKIRQRSCTSPL